MARSKIRADQAAADVSSDAKPRLADKAYQAILQGLFDRTIPAGVKLSQGWLIETLGLTAQPLRDALRMLEMEGLVKIYPRSSISFVKADAELAVSTYQFRSLIERAGARALAEGGDAIQIQGLVWDHTALLKHLNKNDFGAAEEAKLAMLEERLHGTLVSALRNPLIETTARRLHKYFLLVRMDRLVTKPLAVATLHEHLEILNAAIRRDPDAAEAALADHFRQALQRVLGVS
ncbi:MAG: GntR family transcriptional regulator [Rhizomicrobium sp.]|jgi:DNA-binding GntR family transcriptional regulator